MPNKPNARRLREEEAVDNEVTKRESGEARVESRVHDVPDDDSRSGSSQFSTESEGESEYEDLVGDAEDVEHSVVDASQRNTSLAMFYDPRTEQHREGMGEMIYDPSAYAMLHQLNLTWPALSFDFCPLVHTLTEAPKPTAEPPVGNGYPIALAAVLGTQAEHDNDNEMYFLHLYNMHRTYKRDEDAPEEDLALRAKWEGTDEMDEYDSDSDVDDEAGFRDPRIETLGAYHTGIGSINRVRHHPRDNLVAMWTGHEVRVYSSKTKSVGRSSVPPVLRANMKAEGFALDWSKTPHHPSLLICGNSDGLLAVFQDVSVSSDITTSVTVAYSIEDVQTSPTQPNVFLAGGTDGIVQVFDQREQLNAKMDWKVTRPRASKKKGKVQQYGLDVNVIAWHPMQMTSHLVATGGDDGAVRVWDLRAIRAKGAEDPEAVLVEIPHHHCSPINSIQWSPHNESVCAVCSDTEVGIYDFSLERDFQEEFDMLRIQSAQDAPEWLARLQKGDENGQGALPAQLLFEHGGLQYAKEVRFHPTIPGVLGVSHENGFHVFRPCNWNSLMQ